MQANVVGGALIASMSAGAMLAIPIMMLGLIVDAAPSRSALLAAPLILALATLFGFAISLIPDFVGAATLGRAGANHQLFVIGPYGRPRGSCLVPRSVSRSSRAWVAVTQFSARSACCAR